MSQQNYKADPTATAEIQEYYDRVTKVLEGVGAQLQANVLSNVIASFALATGQEPYGVARNIYKNAKAHIATNLNSAGIRPDRKGVH